ncbi:MAG: hypothetical protein ACFFDN_06945 [Candidatus Hodarchaeota archaeon]
MVYNEPIKKSNNRKEEPYMVVSKKEFDAYESVRVSGVTNMWNVSLVSELSGLKKDKILYIMKNYSELKEHYYEENNNLDKKLGKYVVDSEGNKFFVDSTDRKGSVLLIGDRGKKEIGVEELKYYKLIED